MKLTTRFSTFIFTLALMCLAACEMAIPPFLPTDRPDNGEPPVVIPTEAPDTAGWNIPAEAITIAEAREICAGLASEEKTTTKYYVMGYVKKLHNKHADGVANYGNAQFYMEDVKGANSSEDFMAYQVYGINNQKITEVDAVAVGDFVVIYGPLTNYNGTFETTGQGSAHIWKSTNPLLDSSNKPQEPEELVIPEEAKAWNIPAEAIDVMKAREICAALAAGDSTEEKYYVMGYVKQLHANHASGITGYGNAQFYMENIKGKNSTSDFMAFQVYGINGTKINNPDAVAVGDFVVVYGKLTNFMGNTYETVGKGSAHIWRSTNPLMVASKPEPKEVTVFEELVDTKASFEKFTVHSVLGDAKWKAPASKTKFANINAVNNEDWLITPALNLAGMSEASLSFKYKFSETVPAELQSQYTVVVSKDHDGNVENISKATWVELKGISYETTAFADSAVVISLPAEMIGNTCYVAWKYATKDTCHQWGVKEVAIKAMTKVD